MLLEETTSNRKSFLRRLRSKKSAPSGEMSFIEHLEELRWHIIRSVIAVVIGAIVVFVNAGYIVDKIFMGPAHSDFITYKWLCSIGNSLHMGDVLCLQNFKTTFQSTAMTEQFMTTFTIAFVAGFVLAFPYIFWEFWRFIKPALKADEIKKTRGVIFWVSVLFFLGIAFGYFILTPFMVNFYFNYKLSPLIEIRPTISDYLENLIYTTVGIGLLFQMPLVVMVLARIGIINAKFLRKYRRHAFVIILILAAIITPSTDPFSLTLVTMPLYALFEVSISLAARIEKRSKAKKETEEWD